MPTTRITTTLAAGATNPNILDGSLYEIIRRNGQVLIASVADDGTNVLAEALLDTDVILEESPVPLEPGAGLGPNLDEHTILREPAGAGDKFTIRLRNLDGANPHTVRTLVSVP